MTTTAQARKPLPLWVGLVGWIVETLLFLVVGLVLAYAANIA
jgi:hypothetical protein